MQAENIFARSSNMKKSLVTFVLALAAFALAAPATLHAIPPSVQEARRNAQAQGIVAAAGEARHANATISRDTATLSARGGIARELGVIISTAQTLHMVALEVNHCSITQTFFEDITLSVAESRLLGSTVIYEHREPGGRHWVVMALSRDNVIAEISAAAAVAENAVAAPAPPAGTATAPAPAARLSPLEQGRLSAMDAIRRMDEALDIYFRNAD